MRAKESMSVPARTVYLFGFYMIFEAITMLISPPSLLHLLGIPLDAAIWLRLVGGIIAALVPYYLVLARQEIIAFFRLTVLERTTEFVVCLALVWLNAAPRVLILFGIIELLGAGLVRGIVGGIDFAAGGKLSTRGFGASANGGRHGDLLQIRA